jgi:hypothetical protein
MIGYIGQKACRTQQGLKQAIIKILLCKGHERKIVRAIHLLLPHPSTIYKARIEYQTYNTRIKNCKGVQRFSV